MTRNITKTDGNQNQTSTVGGMTYNRQKSQGYLFSDH